MIKILVVEDSKTYNNTFCSFLKKPNYEISQAFNLKEAKKILKTKKLIDYIILDLYLPDGEGDDLIHELTFENVAAPKVIVLSGSHDIQKRNYLFEQGVIDYFSKDIPLKLLTKDIHTLIDSLNHNRNKNILIVDDSSFVRKTLNKILKSKNFNLFDANNPIEAFKILDKTKMNLIFTDLEMPNMDGIAFLEKIKKKKEYFDVPIIILSGNKTRENYTRALKHGAIDFIEKPFLAEEILLKADLHISQSDYVTQITMQAQELQEYKRILNESDIIVKTNPNGIITEVNDKFCQISGYANEYVIGKPTSIMRHPDMPKKVIHELTSKIQEHKTFKGILKNKKRDGSPYYVDATISPIIDIHGNIKEIIGIRHDITDVMNPKKQLLADLSYLDKPILIFLQIANYDLFKEFYSETIMHTFEFEFEQIILNYFPKYSNLKKVYTLGNGLFGFLKNQTMDEKEIHKFLQKALDKFREIGISFKDTHYDIDVCFSFANEGTHILDDVHIGIQHALKNKIQIIYALNYHRRAQIEARNKLKNIGIIKEALVSSDNFISLFQPIFNNKTDEIEKYESLIRLLDKDGKLVSPFQFLDLAKKTGYYSVITEFVINNSFKALEHTNKGITINLSLSDIENDYLRKYLFNLITKKENIGRITLELLEDEEVSDFDIIQDFIIKVKEQGKVKIAIDDFGSGYSNYERLLDFHPDILKIDGSLIKNIVNDEYSRHVVESIVLFAQKQNIQTVAEFVSTIEIHSLIKKFGIDFSQGYYLGEPKKLF